MLYIIFNDCLCLSKQFIFISDVIEMYPNQLWYNAYILSRFHTNEIFVYY